MSRRQLAFDWPTAFRRYRDAALGAPDPYLVAREHAASAAHFIAQLLPRQADVDAMLTHVVKPNLTIGDLLAARVACGVATARESLRFFELQSSPVTRAKHARSLLFPADASLPDGISAADLRATSNSATIPIAADVVSGDFTIVKSNEQTLATSRARLNRHSELRLAPALKDGRFERVVFLDCDGVVSLRPENRPVTPYANDLLALPISVAANGLTPEHAARIAATPRFSALTLAARPWYVGTCDLTCATGVENRVLSPARPDSCGPKGCSIGAAAAPPIVSCDVALPQLLAWQARDPRLAFVMHTNHCKRFDAAAFQEVVLSPLRIVGATRSKDPEAIRDWLARHHRRGPFVLLDDRDAFYRHDDEVFSRFVHVTGGLLRDCDILTAERILRESSAMDI